MNLGLCTIVRTLKRAALKCNSEGQTTQLGCADRYEPNCKLALKRSGAFARHIFTTHSGTERQNCCCSSAVRFLAKSNTHTPISTLKNSSSSQCYQTIPTFTYTKHSTYKAQQTNPPHLKVEFSEGQHQSWKQAYFKAKHFTSGECTSLATNAYRHSEATRVRQKQALVQICTHC